MDMTIICAVLALVVLLGLVVIGMLVTFVLDEFASIDWEELIKTAILVAVLGACVGYTFQHFGINF